MKSFKEQLGGDNNAIRQSRVNNFVNVLLSNSNMYLETGENSKQTYRQLQIELEGILDVAPGTTMDLMSRLSRINPAELMKSVNEKAAKMLKVATIIERRVALHNAMFPENPVTGLTDEELDFLKPLVRRAAAVAAAPAADAAGDAASSGDNNAVAGDNANAGDNAGGDNN